MKVGEGDTVNYELVFVVVVDVVDGVVDDDDDDDDVWFDLCHVANLLRLCHTVV